MKICRRKPKDYCAAVAELNTDFYERLTQYPKPPVKKNHVVIWLISNRDHIEQSLRMLNNRLPHFQSFTDIDELNTFMNVIEDEKIILIYSHDFSPKGLPNNPKASQIVTKYLFYHGEPQNEQTNQDDSYDDQFNNVQDLCDHITSSIYLSKSELASFEFLDSPSSSSFIKRYLLEKIISREMTSYEKSKADFIEYCRKKYPDQHSFINEFEENYTPLTSIWWLTRQSFLSDLVEDCIRLRNIELLLKMSFFLQDVNREIQRSFATNLPSYEMIVYRGHGMLQNELSALKDNPNNLLQFHNFLRTDTNRDTQLSLAKAAINNPSLCGVIFKFEINSSVRHVSLEDIGYYLDSRTEILFGSQNIFRIKQIKRDVKCIWEVHLALVQKGEPQLEPFLQMIDDIPGETYLQKLGHYLLSHKMYDDCIILYNSLIETKSIKDLRKLISIYEDLAFIYHKKQDLYTAILYYEKILAFIPEFAEENDPYFYPVYLNIAFIFRLQNRYNNAIKYFKKALTILFQSSRWSNERIPKTYCYIAEMYYKKGTYLEAIDYYKLALKYQLKLSPIPYDSLAEVYYEMGKIYKKIADYNEAMVCFNQSLDVQKRYLEPNRPLLAITYYHIAKICSILRRNSEAVEYAAYALNIARHLYGSDRSKLRFYEELVFDLKGNHRIVTIPNGSVYQ